MKANIVSESDLRTIQDEFPASYIATHAMPGGGCTIYGPYATKPDAEADAPELFGLERWEVRSIDKAIAHHCE